MSLTTESRLTRLAPNVSVIVRPAEPSPKPSRSLGWLVVGVVVLGFVLRVQGYVRNPSFWIDEAMLAVNVVERTPAQLLEPLDWNQGAPVGFLLTVKLASEAFGGTEYALRLVPLLAGLGGFAAFVPLAYRLLPLSAARLAVALFAVSPYLAGYCAEFKQYESDAALAVLLLLLGRPVWQNTAGRGRLVGLAVAGAGSVWCSHPAVFVLGGVGTVILADALARRDRTAFLFRSAVVGAWVGSFAACYLLFVRKLGHNQYLLDYWAGQFMPLPPVRPGDLMWLVEQFFEFFQKPGGANANTFGLAGLTGFAYLVGVRAADWRLRVALLVPMGLALLASGLHKYPFANRLLLFAVPGAILLVALGTAELAARIGRAWPGFGWLFVGLIGFAPVAESYWLMTRKPIHAEDAREAITAIRAEYQPGDRIYVYHGAAPAVEYYRRWLPLPSEAVRVGATPRLAEDRGPDQTPLVRDLTGCRGLGRVWVLFAHHQKHHEAAARAVFVDAEAETVFRGDEAVVLRFDGR